MPAAYTVNVTLSSEELATIKTALCVRRLECNHALRSVREPRGDNEIAAEAARLDAVIQRIDALRPRLAS